MKSALARCLGCLLLSVMMFAWPAVAQEQPAETRAPDPAFSEMLIKNTIVALNHANLTGNYSVLRELGTPAFQTKNSTARLSEAFAALREQGIDMSGIVLLKPNLTDAVRQKDLLELKGFFPSEPLQVRFHAVFAAFQGRMRLHGVAVSAGPSNAEPERGNLEPEQRGAVPSGRSDFGLASP